jgi:molybdenum cofactor guanylyltransferase
MSAEWQLLILAGGEGRRLGGVDKGLMPVNGMAAVQHLRDRWQPRHQRVSANRHGDDYRALGLEPVADYRPGFIGPLAGLEALLAVALDMPAVIVPCDMPWLPDSLPAQLLALLQPDTLVVAHDSERLQPLCMALWPTRWREDLSAYLDHGGRSVQGWLDNKPVTLCRFDDARPFRNINTPEDLNTAL